MFFSKIITNRPKTKFVLDILHFSLVLVYQLYCINAVLLTDQGTGFKLVQQACESVLVSLQDILENKVTASMVLLGWEGSYFSQCLSCRLSATVRRRQRRLGEGRKKW